MSPFDRKITHNAVIDPDKRSVIRRAFVSPPPLLLIGLAVVLLLVLTI